MDEEFISDLYSFLITTEADYQNNQVPYEEFKQGLQDGAFSEELYNYLVTQDPSYAQDVSLEEFQRNVTGLTVAREEELLKKKEDTESSLDPSSSEPPTGEDYYKFMSTSDEDDIGIQEGGGITDLPTNLEVAQEIIAAPSSKGTVKPARKIGIDFLIQDHPLTFEMLKSEEQKLLASEIPKEDLQNYERLQQQIQSIKIPNVKYPEATKEYKERMRLINLKRKIEEEHPVLTSWYEETPLSLDAEQKKYIGDLNKYKSEKDKDFLATDTKQREDAIRQNFLEGGSVDEFGEAVESGTDIYEENIEKFINFDLINGKGFASYLPGFDTTEEDAVSTMRSVFGDLGFKFEETGAGDNMIVTAPNGASKKIVLDQYGSKGDIEQMNILKDFMRKNKPKIQKDAKLRRYESEEQVKADSDYLNFLADNYGKQKLNVEKANDEYYKLLASYNNMSDRERNSETGRALQANLIERKSSIAKQQRTLDYDAKALMKRGSEIDVAAGKYASLQKDLGTTFAGKLANIFTKGAMKGSNIIASGTTGTAMDIMSVLTDAGVLDGGPEHALAISKEGKEALNNAILKKYGRTYEELLNDDSIGEEKLQEIQDFYNSKKRNYARFEQKKQIQGDIRRGYDKIGFGTQEAYNDLKENSEFWKVAYSVGESLPSMVYSISGPMGFFQSTQFAKDMFDEEIQNAENGREIDTREVAIYNSLLGVPIAALDKLGFGWAVKGTGGKLLAQAIAKSAYKDVAKTGAKLTAKSWQKSVMKTIENKVAKFLVGSAGAGASEFVTGGLQGFVEYTGKPLINYFKDEKVYDTPELNSSKYWKGVWENAYYEMLGGLFMGVPIGIAQSMSKQDFSKMDNDSWELFKQMRNDPNLLKLSDSKFLEEIALGNSTPMMALKIKNQFKEASNLLDQIPNADAYTTEQQKDIMGLLLRRHELQNRVKGKDKALSSKDNAEITKIEQKLAEFADTAGDVNYALNKTDDRFKNLKDDDKVEVVVESLEDVPNNQYGLPMEGTKKRKTGTFEEVEVGENVNGLPIGKNKKKVSGTYYTYTLTGKQIKDAIQEQSTNEVDANQSAPNVQEMEGGASETGPEVTAQQEGQQVSEEQQVQKEKLNNLGFTDEIIEMMTPEDIEVAQTYTEPSQATEMVERYQQDVEAAKALAAEDTTTEGVETVGVAGEVTEQNKGKIKYNPIQSKIIRQAQKAVQSIKKIMPNLRIITYATDEEYVAAVPGSKIGERGEISDDGNTIRINLAAADETTVGHEIFHAIITSKFNINSKKIATAVNNDLIKKLLKILPKDKYKMNVVDKITKERKQISLHQYLEEYVEQYEDTETHSEEKLAQIFGFLGANYSTLTYQEQSIITKFFNKLRTLFGKEAKGIEFSKDEARVADLLNTLAYKVKVGEEIQEGDLQLLDEIAEEVEGQPTETTTEEAPVEAVVEEAPTEEAPKTKTKGKLIKEGKSHIFIKKYPDSKTGFKLTIKEVLPNGLIRFEKNKNINNTNNLFRKDNEGNYVEVLPDNKTGQVIGFKPAKTKAAPAETTTEKAPVTEPLKLKKESAGYYVAEGIVKGHKVRYEVSTIEGRGFTYDIYIDDARVFGDGWYGLRLKDIKEGMMKDIDSAFDEKFGKDYQGKAAPTSRKQVAGMQAYLSELQEQNKITAEQMEKQNKSPKEIKRATGWERGKDRRWRLEIDYNKLKALPKKFNKLLKVGDTFGDKEIFKLSDLIVNQELFDAYKKLEKDSGYWISSRENDIADLPVTVVVGDDMSGSYQSDGTNWMTGETNGPSISVEINPKTFSEEDFLNVLNHEIQHHIQALEFFEQGNAPTMQLLNDVYNRMEELQKRRLELEGNLQRKEETLQMFGKETGQKLIKQQEAEANKLDKEINKLRPLVLNKDGSDVDYNYGELFDLYERVAGEVEAVNVEERSKMTKEQRLNTLLKETEKTPREKQISFKDTGDKDIEVEERLATGIRKIPTSRKQVAADVELFHVTSEGFTDFNVMGMTDGKTESPRMELGIHLGTKEQSENRAKTKKIPKDKKRLLKVKINPKKTVRVEDVGRWTLSKYRNILGELGLISKERSVAKKEIKSFNDVLKVLNENNIDAFVYNNKYEGEGDSYIVFDNKTITQKEVSEETPTSRKQVAADGSVAPMKVNEEFSKMTPEQKRKQLGGRYGILSLELRKNLLFAEEEYKRRDEYDRLSKSNKLKDMDLFAKKFQSNPPMTEKQIFINTGWYRGIDGEYRYEIPDGKLVKGTYQEFTRESKNPDIREARLDEIYIAPEVYKTYPFIKDIMVQFVPMLETNNKGEVVADTQTRGSWNNGTKIIKINTNSEDFAKSTSAQQKTRILSTIVHEVQHAIQHFEGFALGSSPIESKAGLGKRVKEKFGEGKEDLTKEEIFASEAQKGLRKRYEMFRINKEFLSHYITVVNALEQSGDIANRTKLLNSKNKGKDLLKIVRDQETNPKFNNVYKELKADAKYYYDEVANKKITVTENVLGKFLDNMLDFSALNAVQTAKEINSIDKKLRKMLQVYDAFNMYSRTYGEIESRNVQERLKKKKELAYLKSEINKVERLGKKKGVKQEEQLERIEQLEEQLYRELPTVREDDQGLVEDVNKDIQGPYIIKKEATGKRSLTEENAKAKEKLEGMNRKQLPSPNASMEDVIAWGRSRGESDAVLRMFLKSRGYGTIKEIREAMAQTVQMAAMPPDLANIEGGLEVAEKMYEDIMTKFYDATMETREVVAESKKRIAKAKRVMQNNPEEYGVEKDGVFIKKDKKGKVISKQTLDITKAKRGVKIITATQVLGAPRTSMESVFTKSKAQRRAILQQIIESNEDYQNQDEANKANIQRLLDRALNTRANPSVEQRMRDVKRIAKAAEQNEKKLQEVRNRLRALIRESIPRNLQDETTTKNLNAMIKSLAKVNSTNVLVETKNILKEIERINKKEINSLKNKALKIIKQKSSTAKQGKTTGVDAETNMFMQEIKKIWLRMDELLKAENSGELIDEYLNEIQEKLEEEIKDEKGNVKLADIDTIIQKTIDGTPLNAREKRKLYTNFAYDMMYNYPSLDYEGMQLLYEEIADLKAEGIAKFKSNREARVKRNAKLEAEAVEQLKLKYPYLVKENGDFMDEQEIQEERAKLFDKWKKTRSFKAVKDWSRIVLNKKKQKYSEWFRAWLATNQTLNNALDVQGVGKSFFTKNVYQRLRDMRDAFLNGDEAERLKMNEMLNTIPGIAEKVSRFKNPYAVLVDMLAQPNITVQDNVYTRDEALRIYALSKNEVQREKLRVGTDKKGRGTFITDEGIQEIIDQLQPELIEYADKMVDYLSNDYYNSVNDVYMQVNSAALPYVENYFPTKTTNPQSDRNKIQKQLEKGDVDFNQVFNAETAPALHERTNVSGRIPLKGYTFTAELSSHFEQMERFKAYAEGVKIIRDIVNMDSVNSVLDVTGLKEVYLRNLMTTINPNAFQSKGPESIFGKALNNFSSFVLGFKLWQIPKQATSFINAFEDYDSGLIKRDVDGLGLTKSAADMLMFMVDMSTTTASLAFELMPKSLRESLGIPDGPITQAYRVSPTFRNRIQEAAKGDLWGLESGSRIKYNETADSESIIPRKLRLLPRKIRKVGAYPTMIGDVLGVMGYMINYRRDIRNGMSQEEALRKFNRYEATQQTRSETEKNRLQLESNDYLRAFTMFGSTPFLQQNKIAQASSNMMQAISRGRMPRKQDMRSLVLNLGVANVAFIYMSNIFKYAFGDDEDKEKVMKHMKKVMLGFNSLAAVPFIGPVIEAMDNYYQEGKTWSQDLGVNPVMQAWNKFRQAYEGKPKYKDIPKMLINIMGINTDPFVALYNKTIGDGDFFEKDEDYYKLRGISKSYRPKGAEEGETEEDIRQDLLDMGIEESELDEYMKDMK